MGTVGSVNAFTIVLLSIVPFCIILSCCAYVFNRKKQRKRQNIQFNNDHYAPDATGPVFIVEMPHLESPVQTRETSPPSYDTVDNPAMVENSSHTSYMNYMQTT